MEGGQLVQGLPTSANMAKVHDPREDSLRPAETSMELVSIFPVAAGDVQTVVDTTQTDALQVKRGGGNEVFPCCYVKISFCTL